MEDFGNDVMSDHYFCSRRIKRVGPYRIASHERILNLVELLALGLMGLSRIVTFSAVCRKARLQPQNGHILHDRTREPVLERVFRGSNHERFLRASNQIL